MKYLPYQEQLFYSETGEVWFAAIDGVPWSSEKCDGYLYKHMSWSEFQEILNTKDGHITKLAQDEMMQELNWCDLQVKLHMSNDRRAVATIEDIYAHSRDCRDYVQNIDGVLTIIGDKPVRPK